MQAAKDGGAKLGVQVHTALVQTVRDLDEAFAMAQRERVDGIFVQPTSLSRSYRVPMAELGAAGAARTLALLSGADDGPRVRIHPVELVIRESTAAPSQVLSRVAL